MQFCGVMNEEHEVDMSVEENDWVALASVLDRAATEDEAAVISARMANNPALAAAMDDLRAGTSERAAYWKGLEPSESDAQALADRIRAATRQTPATNPWRWWRGIASIAACVAISFGAGWGLHAYRVTSSIAHLPSPTNREFHVTLNDLQGKV